MHELSSLPRARTWEVDVVPIPGGSGEMLFVCEHERGLIRQLRPFSPRDDLAALLAEAAATPPPPSPPSLPAAILCRTHLLPRLAMVATALGAPIQVRDELPAVDEAATAMLSSLAGGLPSKPEEWAPILAMLMDESPWRGVPETVQFRYPGDESLTDSVGVVLGHGGGKSGFALYPTLEDYEAFAQMLSEGMGEGLPYFASWCLHLDPIDDFPAPLVNRLRSLGLVYEGLAPRLFAMEGVQARALTAEEELVFKRALVGVLGAWKAEGPSLSAAPAVTAVTMDDGALQVLAMPGGLLEGFVPMVLDRPHQAGVLTARIGPTEHPMLLLKMSQEDADELTRRVQGLDGIQLEPTDEGKTRVIGWVGEQALGALTELTLPREVWNDWRERSRGMVAVSAGGMEEPGFSPTDFVSLWPVAFLDEDDG